MPSSNFKKTFVRSHPFPAVLTALAIIVFCLYFLVIPFYKKTIAEKQEEIANYDKTLEERLVQFKKLRDLKDDYEAIESAEREKLGYVLPASDEIPELFLVLDTIAKQSGLSLTSIDAAEHSPAAGSPANPISQGIKILEISLTVNQGNYEKFKMFLDKLERNIRLLDVQSLDFDKSFESIGLILNTYYYSEEPSVPEDNQEQGQEKLIPPQDDYQEENY